MPANTLQRKALYCLLWIVSVFVFANHSLALTSSISHNNQHCLEMTSMDPHCAEMSDSANDCFIQCQLLAHASSSCVTSQGQGFNLADSKAILPSIKPADALIIRERIPDTPPPKTA